MVETTQADNVTRIKDLNERISALKDRKIKAQANKENLERSITTSIKEIAARFPDLGLEVPEVISYESVSVLIEKLKAEAQRLEEKERAEIEKKNALVESAEAKLEKIDNEAI